MAPPALPEPPFKLQMLVVDPLSSL